MTITMVHITLLAAGLATLAASPAYSTDAAWAPHKAAVAQKARGRAPAWRPRKTVFCRSDERRWPTKPPAAAAMPPQLRTLA